LFLVFSAYQEWSRSSCCFVWIRWRASWWPWILRGGSRWWKMGKFFWCDIICKFFLVSYSCLFIFISAFQERSCLPRWFLWIWRRGWWKPRLGRFCLVLHFLSLFFLFHACCLWTSQHGQSIHNGKGRHLIVVDEPIMIVSSDKKSSSQQVRENILGMFKLKSHFLTFF